MQNAKLACSTKDIFSLLLEKPKSMDDYIQGAIEELRKYEKKYENTLLLQTILITYFLKCIHGFSIKNYIYYSKNKKIHNPCPHKYFHFFYTR